MKIFLTIGTTPFESLIEAVDQSLSINHEIIFQIGPSTYSPINGYFQKYFPNIESEYKKAELVITHAGAGTVFPLLEMNSKIIVVPNLYRRDLHQNELAKFVESNKFGIVAWDVYSLPKLIDSVPLFPFQQYNKYDFCLGDELNRLIKDSCQTKRV